MRTEGHFLRELTILVRPTANLMTGSPFLIANASVYEQWRKQKLKNYPADAEALKVAVESTQGLSRAERRQIADLCRKTNMAIYVSPNPGVADKQIVHVMGAAFGLQGLDQNPLADEDGITSLKTVPGKSQRGYIPYSSKRLLWHTDGYYNPPERRIGAFLLHCVNAAAQGGENQLLDHEIAYILMRDANPAFVQALMHPQAMTVPANTEEGMEVRPPQTGPVFAIDPSDGGLHMRYTSRTRSIQWRQGETTIRAVQFLEQLLTSDSPYIFRYRLNPGEGLLCNNVLHNRTEFVDDPDGGPARLIFRARYYNRIAAAGL